MKATNIFRSMRETATCGLIVIWSWWKEIFLPKFKAWWDRDVLSRWRKIKMWCKKPQNQNSVISWSVFIIFGAIVISALYGNSFDAKIVNTVFRVAIFVDILKILQKLKSIREALLCILLVIVIAAVLKHLGIATPEWLMRFWDFLKAPDFVGLYKSIINWIFGEFPNFFPW